MSHCLNGASHLALVTAEREQVQEQIDSFFERRGRRTLKELGELLEPEELKDLFGATPDPPEIMGIITLEDVLEEALH